jgi:ribonuclease E
MSKEIYISSTPHETRLAIVENDVLTEIYYERENEYTLAGSIYNGKVTRVLPGMQSSFVDIGLERDAFLYITDFMEEAGDSADFDTSGNGDSNRSRTTGRDRNNGAPTIEGTVAAPSEQTADAAPRGDRNGRGDRSRGRGRRDRGGNRDRQPMADPLAPTGEHDSFNAPVADFLSTEDATENAPIVSTDETSLGEGAPGADGSRRWRGRRGRRRGRGTGQREGAPQAAGAPTTEAVGETAFDEDSFDIDATVAAASTTAPIASAYTTTEATNASPEDANRNDRGDRNRSGGRDRNDRNNRGNRSDRGGREARAPRGFAPKTSLYGVDDAPAYNESPELTAGAEPIVLPGESLSKYRKGGEEPAASASAFATAANVIIPAAPEFVIPSGWDGGATLPGESLSRHRRDEKRQGSHAEHRANSSRETRAEYRNEPQPHAEVIHDADGVSVAETIEEQPEVLLATHPELVASVEVEHEEPIPSAPVEYEPTDASASYRVDPVAPSEFRQSAPVLELPEVHETPVESHVFASTHSITPVPELHVQEIHTEDLHVEAVHAESKQEPVAITYEKFDWQTEPAPAAYDLTTLHATGDMISEAPETIAAPVGGAFVEETLDEEDYNTTLHASSIEEMDDFEEEETLEGAADLGTMLREMSIDQITRSGDVDEAEEEDDFEEEDAIHDPLHDELSSDDDDEEDLDESDTEEDVIHEEFAEGTEGASEGSDQAQAGSATPAPGRSRENDRSRGRRDGRRDGRRERFGRSDRNDRPRHTGGAGDRERSGGGGRDRRGGRSSMQSTNLPAISELLKPGQEILVQIAKEPIAKKGARITSHIALPGRFLVFMPTVNHTGVSRKIESDGERRRLKEILLSEKGEASGGFIVRTAASGASEEELRSDLRFLLNLWADIKTRSESSKSPALIYHDLNLVERILRDQVTDNFSAIWVDSETDYERILRFLQRFQPSLIRRVKLYTKETPLFEQFGITEEINKALRSKVWLKSGGSIVINQTEALVAIDINTGKFVGKTARLEDTIVKTNLDAIPEIVRQIRLRDLGGIIIIDFIDMDERKNRNRVMAALEDELKSDRAPSKVLQFNDFGLVAITRKRVKQSLERTLSTTCNVCVGTGMVKSPVTVCNDIYIEMRKMQKHLDRGDVMLRVNPEVVKQLKAPGTKWLQEMEEMVGKTILVKSDPSLHPEQFDIH